MKDTRAADPGPSEQVRTTDDPPQFREVIEETAVLRPVPPLARESAIRARRAFLNEAARMRACRGIRPAVPRFQLLRAVAPAAAALLVLLGLLGGAIAAAQEAAPDSLLYPGKLAWEDLRLALTTDPQARAELALTFAETRVAEIEGMVAAGRPVPEAVQLRLEAQLQQALRYAAQLPDAPMSQFLIHMEVRVQQRAREMHQALAGTPEQYQEMLQWTAMVLERSREMAAFGQEDPAAFRQLGGGDVGVSRGDTPTPPTVTTAPTRPSTARSDPTAPSTVGQGDGPNPSRDPGPGKTPSGPAGPTPEPTNPSSPTPRPTSGPPDNTPGPPDNTPGPPDNTPGPPDNTPGPPDNTPGGGRPARP